jgi:hypothetical protein
MGTPAQHRILDSIHSQLVTLAANDCELLAGKSSICFIKVDCGDVSVYLRYLNKCVNLHPIFRAWPEFSGNINFPIRATYTTTNTLNIQVHATAYDDAELINTLWCNATRYGRSRCRLLLFIIDYLARAQTDDILLDSLFSNINSRTC